jgi:uncharacterized protein YdcH (DUF465 family)
MLTGRSLVETEVGHHPDLEACHANCEAAQGGGEHGICQCKCCGFGDNQDGCYCYFCAPLGLPVSPFSQHHNNVLEEPASCPGSKHMCGGMFGSTIRTGRQSDTAGISSKLKKGLADKIMQIEEIRKGEYKRASVVVRENIDTNAVLQRENSRFHKLNQEYQNCQQEINSVGGNVTRLDYLLVKSLDPKISDLKNRIKGLKNEEMLMLDRNSKGLLNVHKEFSKLAHSNLRN